MSIDEDFATNLLRPKFLSLLFTVKIRIGVAEKGTRCISRYSKVVHNIELSLTFSELTVHLQNQL